MKILQNSHQKGRDGSCSRLREARFGGFSHLPRHSAVQHSEISPAESRQGTGCWLLGCSLWVGDSDALASRSSLPPTRGRAGERGIRLNDAGVSKDPPHPTLPRAGGREEPESHAIREEVTGEISKHEPCRPREVLQAALRRAVGQDEILTLPFQVKAR
jgi:hypothetical protein